MSRTHYSTLGVEPSATRDAIKRSYYDLRKQFSALKRPTDKQKERLVRINAAWDVLKLADRRRQYDEELGLGVETEAPPDADEAYRESVRRTAAARKAASDAAAAAAERRAEAAAAARRAKTAKAAPSSPMADEPAFEPGERAGLPGGTRWWAMGAGFAVAYFALSAAVNRTPAPPPAMRSKPIEAAVPRENAPTVRPGPRHVRRHKHQAASGRRSTQDAAELNRLELERLQRHQTAPTPSTPSTSSGGPAE